MRKNQIAKSHRRISHNKKIQREKILCEAGCLAGGGIQGGCQKSFFPSLLPTLFYGKAAPRNNGNFFFKKTSSSSSTSPFPIPYTFFCCLGFKMADLVLEDAHVHRVHLSSCLWFGWGEGGSGALIMLTSSPFPHYKIRTLGGVFFRDIKVFFGENNVCETLYIRLVGSPKCKCQILTGAKSNTRNSLCLRFTSSFSFSFLFFLSFKVLRRHR